MAADADELARLRAENAELREAYATVIYAFQCLRGGKLVEATGLPKEQVMSMLGREPKEDDGSICGSATALPLYSTATLVEDVVGKGCVYTAGARGQIVDIHDGGTAYEVEIVLPPRVITVPRAALVGGGGDGDGPT